MADRIVLLVLTTVVLFIAGDPCGAEDLRIPLKIHEALRAGVSGVGRHNEPVTVGIPFPKGSLSEKNGDPQLALEGVSEYQFRTLAKWPDQSVRWALVDFQTDIKAGASSEKVHIVRGNGATPGRLAEERDGIISVNTGLMEIQIRKKGFNLFDSVVMNGTQIIAKGASEGIVIAGEEGTKYFALNDSNARVSIEENGPVRAVVKAEGSHIGQNGRTMAFTVRMHFYKGQSRARVFYTLRNAGSQQLEHAYIRSLDLVTKIAAQGEIAVTVSGHNKACQGTLAPGSDSLVYYQAVSDFPQEYAGDAFYDRSPIPPDYAREKQRGFVQEGYWIRQGDRELARGRRNEYPDLSFLDVSDTEGRGVTVGIRFAAGWWPKSLRANSDGTIEVGLWPAENDTGYWIRYGSHNTFEIMYDFHASRNDPDISMKRFQYPLVAKAPVDWYNLNAGGIYPLYNFPSSAGEKSFFKNRGWEYRVGWRRPGMKIYRYHYWGWGGPGNQHDFARIALVNFLKETEDATRGSEYFLGAEARFNYNADWAVFHSDGYDLSTVEKGRWRLPDPEKNRGKAQLGKVIFEWEHPHWYGLPLYYYATGDERIKEAILDWAEYVKKTHTSITMGPYPRVWGWGMYTLAAMYDFTGDKSFMEMADNNFQWLLNSHMDPQNPRKTLFIDWNRGYIAGGSGSGWDKDPGIKPGLMTGYAIFDGLFNYYLHMDNENTLREKVADVLEGLTEFFYREPYFEGEKGPKKHWAFWLPYVYDLQEKSKSNHAYRLILQAFYVNLADYLLNGGERWLDRMDKIIRMAGWDESGMWGHFGYIDHPGLQSMFYIRTHPRSDTIPPEPVVDVSAKSNGKNVILNWTAPSDAVRYQIKYSTKKLVESLEFDPDERSYKYDPNEYINWYAGENIANEPMPDKPGTNQSCLIKSMKPGSYHFAIRTWDNSNNRSRISNLAEIEIK